jgi:hypothetical protein
MFTSSSLKLAPSNQDTIFGIVNSALSPPRQKTLHIAPSIKRLNIALVYTKASLIADDRDY